MKLVIAVMILILSTSAAFGSEIPDSTALQLLEEIRQMRTIMQQTLPLQLRSQVLLERIRQQREIINDLRTSLEIARQESINQARQRADLEEQERDIESRRSGEPVTVESSQAISEVRGIRKAIEQSKILESQYKDKETDYLAALAKEEARMGEFTVSLEELIAAIGK